jgi:3-oxoacyl-[acyl-carrier protein] reductase
VNLGLEGRKVVVTGASRGIGAAVARAFAEEGAELALLARSRDALSSLVEELGHRGCRAVAVPADLSERSSLDDALARAVDALGGVDVLVNNAGASPFGSFDAITDEQWRESFELKVMGYVGCIRAVLPHMRAQRRGTILNVVGAAGRNATAGYVLGALNAALLHLTRSLADLLARDGIRIAALNPGFTNTERMRSAMAVWADEQGAEVDAYTREYAARLPLGRFAEPEEIAGLVVMLASDRMELTLGSSLQADGGSAGGHF